MIFRTNHNTLNISIHPACESCAKACSDDLNIRVPPKGISREHSGADLRLPGPWMGEDHQVLDFAFQKGV